MRQRGINPASPGVTPSYATLEPLPLIERVVPMSVQARLLTPDNSYLRAYTLGECSILVTREFGRWHMSLSHQSRYPTWDEVAEARYRLLPGSITAAMLLPPKEEYINIHEFCFQVMEIASE